MRVTFNKTYKVTDPANIQFTYNRISLFTMQLQYISINPYIYNLSLTYDFNQFIDKYELTEITLNGIPVQPTFNYTSKFEFDDNTGIFYEYDNLDNLLSRSLPEGAGTPDVEAKRCDCGVDSVMGVNSDLMFHSSWCKLKNIGA